MTHSVNHWARVFVLFVAATMTGSTGWSWPMPWCGGPDGQGGSYFAEKVLNIAGRRSFSENDKVRVQLLECSAPANIFWPGENPTFSFQMENLTDQPLALRGRSM